MDGVLDFKVHVLGLVRVYRFGWGLSVCEDGSTVRRHATDYHATEMRRL